MDRDDVFLSYSHRDGEAAALVRAQLEKAGLSVFWDKTSIRDGDGWLTRLQAAVEACGAFVVLVGRDGVARWVGAETEAALNRHYGAERGAKPLPLFPILLGDTDPEALPPFLRLVQARSWDGTSPLDEAFVQQIKSRNLLPSRKLLEHECPYVGLHAFGPKQAHLFFGRQRETLEALGRFEPRHRWLEIHGNSGSGKSSLMNAGLLPLVDRGWLWSRRRYDGWRRLGPFAPGERPLDRLAEHLARAFDRSAFSKFRRLLNEDGDRALAFLLRGHKPDDETAFVLALDQFEELFTVADEAERRQFDRLLATALEDDDCPLFLFSTVRADFLDRFEALPRLLAARNRLAATWMLGPMVGDALREVVTGPADLADLVVDEVTEALVAQAEGEPGALPLVQNALIWLWERPHHNGLSERHRNRLSGRLLHERGGVAGILASSADELLANVDRERALALLLRLVALDPEGRRHTRQRIARHEAVEAAGGGAAGERLVEQLAGGVNDAERGHLRLIVPTGGGDEPASVELIHETLVQARNVRGEREPKPYWPTLWHHLEAHRGLALQQGRVRLLALRIEDAARAWDAGGRAEADRWREDRFQEAIREVREAGLTMDEVLRDPLARAFFGPADVQAIEAILRAGEAENAAVGSGIYGPAWRTPLGHVGRAALGDRLALIGDTRPGVGVRDGVPDIVWCDVAGGEVTLEVEEEDQPLTAPPTARVARFKMARFPVTIGQYRAFVEATGAEWRPTGRFANQPADSVSWNDARAFCAWLGAQLGLDVRLPTEFEWQLAATGGDPANTYPWGAKWDVAREPWRANTRESGLGRTTAVGVYPHGAAAAGILDLAGNVREWCANLYGTPLSTEATERDERPRVVRGGSWDGVRALARCAARNDLYLPFDRIDLFGFRVVCSSPIVTTDP